MTESAESRPSVTHAMEDYLKAIYALQEADGVVTTQALANGLGVTGPSVTNMLKRLQGLRLIAYEPYQGVTLTPAGRKVALEVIRHHRLLELYLAESLGYGWDEVHAEAERLEHVLSEELEARLDLALGFPTHDPHGDPIPSADGSIEPSSSQMLRDAEPDADHQVARVSDRDPARLRYLGELGLVPGATVAVVERLPFDGVLRIRVEGVDHVVGMSLAESVFVSPPSDGGG